MFYQDSENFNIFSNRYFDLIAYEFSDGGVLKEVPKYKLGYCDESQIKFILP